MASNIMTKVQEGPLPQQARTSRGSSSRQWVAFLADRVAPASFFMFFLVAKGPHLSTALGQAQTADGAGRWQAYLELANQSSTGLFMALIVGLYILRSPSIRKESGALKRTVALAATLMATPLVLAPTTIDNLGVSFLASLLIIGGSAIAVAGILSLRRCFGILPEVRGLVTNGLYDHVRHPMYLGETIAFIGITLRVLSPLTISILAAYLLLQWRRALNEEALLESTFPGYREYSRRTKQFVPLVW